MNKAILIGLILLALLLSGCVNNEEYNRKNDEEHNSKIDYSCSDDWQCVIKPVGCDICSGVKYGCVNRDSVEGICSTSGSPFNAICQALTPRPTSCACLQSKCQSLEADCPLLEEQVVNKFLQANYCSEASDCVVGPPDFYCGSQLVNKNTDLEALKKEVELYQATCLRGDFARSGVKCDLVVRPKVEGIACKGGRCVDTPSERSPVAIPDRITRELLISLYITPGRMKIQEAVFSSNDILSAVALSQNSILSKGEICMNLGDYKDDSAFELTTDGAHRIRYSGLSNKAVDIVVTCNLNKELLEESIQGTVFGNWEYDCSICGEKKCCFVALKKP